MARPRRHLESKVRGGFAREACGFLSFFLADRPIPELQCPGVPTDRGNSGRDDMNNTGTIIMAAATLAAADVAAVPATNRIANGTFEALAADGATPEAWAVAGGRFVHQRLATHAGRDGGRGARLECTEFGGDTPDAHAMLCQAGRVAVRGGQWYRFAFWAKGEGIRGGVVDLALTDMRRWENAGLSETFPVDAKWERHEFLFRAKTDVPAEASRLQFWFKSTGRLWLDDVELVESSGGQQWFPQIGGEGVKNLIPNSSFECGGAGWGSFTYGLSGWAGNLYRLEGEIDGQAAVHGGHSLKIAITPQSRPVFWFDYYEPVRQPVSRVLAANLGWLRVQPGEPLTLSAHLRADAEGVVAQMLVVEAPDRQRREPARVGPQWQRHEFRFTPSQPFLFVAVGPDLEASGRDAVTLWIDAVQLERGSRATPYEPRRPVESFMEATAAGGIFTHPAAGPSLVVRAFNDGAEPRTLKGTLSASDFSDRTVLERPVTIELPKSGTAVFDLPSVLPRRRGYYRALWAAGDDTNSLRCAVIDPAPPTLADSPFGFNHAYPWDFLVRQAGLAGIAWWRDWSAKWDTVEPEKGRFDFASADAQINRVRGLGGGVEVLLPFPSALWCSTAKADEVAKAAGGSAYLRQRMPVAYAPKDIEDFGRYAAAVAKRYRDGAPRPVTHIQILNEPVFTSYALPRQFGYTVEDYVRLLEVSHRWLKAGDPPCRIVGGISANMESPMTREFIDQGGLRFLDVFDLHNYDPPRPAESYEDSFRALEERMRAHGGPREVWITEWGCYADDDPPCVPHSVGDATMNRCRWKSEQAAAEHIVKYAAVAFGHGVRKIFFHAGTCGAINASDAGGVLFEYGGAPRKMLPAVSVFTGLVGVPESCERVVSRDGVEARIFRTGGRCVGVAWCRAGATGLIRPAAGVTVVDIMGNEQPERAELSPSPLYLIGPSAEAVDASLGWPPVAPQDHP